MDTLVDFVHPFSSEEDASYCVDTHGGFFQEPLAIAAPTCTEDVVRLVSFANHYAIPLTPRGKGTGTTGGAVPSQGGIVVHFDNMARIISINPTNRIAIVQPGVLTQTLQEAARHVGLDYPPDPASLATCSIGGNIATNAGGPSAFKYGVTRQYVRGLKGVWGNGQCFTLGGPIHKDVAGLDLIGLLVGSEGTLGIITEATLALVPRPPHRLDLAIDCTQASVAHLIFTRIMQAGLIPVTAEYMEHTGLSAAATYLQVPLNSGIAARLMIQLEGYSQSDLNDQLACIKTCLSNNVHVSVASTLEERNHLWQLRRHISPALKAKFPAKVSHDVVVPLENILPFFDHLTAIGQRERAHVIGYGHIGDGNIHVNILPLEQDNPDWPVLQKKISDQIMQLAVGLGGSITGEHGVGLSKKDYLPLLFDSPTREIFKAIKQATDPNHILNPGKKF